MSLLSQTVALVTGGGSGLGAAAARQLVRHGARVCIADIMSKDIKDDPYWYQDMKASKSLLENIDQVKATTMLQPVVIENGQFHTTTGPAVTYITTDVTNTDNIISALNHIEHVYGEPVNAVVNCAGIARAKRVLSKKGEPHPIEDFVQTMMINTVGTFNVNRLAAQRMITRNTTMDDELKGCIINTASIAAYEGQIGQVAYAASKAAIVGMTLPMARDLASSKIRVMTIAPGLFATPLLDGLPPDVKHQLGSTVPCPSRLGHPDEFGQLVVSILLNKMLNGSVIRLDGALRMPPT